MNTFDKFCAGAAFLVGIVLLILGVFGLIFGCNAHFTLPPILGGIPALVGWGILRSVRVAWRIRPEGPFDGETRCRQCNYILRGITEPRCPECGEPI
jgi:hypothetical protein